MLASSLPVIPSLRSAFLQFYDKAGRDKASYGEFRNVVSTSAPYLQDLSLPSNSKPISLACLPTLMLLWAGAPGHMVW